MSTTVQLKGTVRPGTGKGAARKIRQGGHVPGVLYGQRLDPVLVELDGREFLRVVQGHAISNLIVDFVVEGAAESVKTLIREVQTDPLTGDVVHVDFNRISLTESIEVEVPVAVTGVPVGVKEHGGILQHAVRSLLIKCLAVNIPDEIKVDVSELMIGDSIHVSDLSLPDVEFLEEGSVSVASVVPPTVTKEPVPGEEAEGPAEPELVGRKKEEEEGEGGEKE